MDNHTFRKWNNIVGWLLFGVALFVYLFTLEHKFSFWDTGEYISSATKLEVTHAPGAALFQLVGAVMGIFAFGNGQYYGLVINVMSAVFSAFTILFLFWTITHLVRGIFRKRGGELSVLDDLKVLISGGIGALAFTFSDTFWYSAVEGEVYAMASMFIAILLWLILKWEQEFDTPYAERWLVLIAFLVGLSVGVHMMCMLVIPAVCLIFYAKKYQFSWKSFLWANVITLGILIFVFKLIFPLIMSLFGKTEILVVNGLGLPFNSGTIFAFLVLIGVCYYLLRKAIKTEKKLYQMIVLSVIFMIIGFSCWLVIPIRAKANPPMNLNNPNNAIGMLDYYNREQYGDWPTLYGQNYTAALDNNGILRNEDGSYKTKKDGGLLKFGDIYEPDEATGQYIKVGERNSYVYNPAHISFMPRMFNEDKSVMGNYISMYGAPDFEFNYSNPDIENNPEATKIFEELRRKYDSGTITVDDYLSVKKYDLINVKRPSFFQNLDYFITFQNGYYFVRYLFWNFVGRQNDLEGSMENTKGNWISGISAIDDAILGDQSTMPAKYINESSVKFYFLPLILGIIGFFFQLKKDFGRFYAVLSFFILTSVGIIFYTGVKPFEPRERDYAMVGSFYAFAIWIGLGAVVIMNFVNNKIKSGNTTILTGVVLAGIPLMMGFQNYAPHDRSGRHTAYDFAYSTLKSLNKNDILFVYGDNDTYPLWAIQETEQFRNDVKVVNFTLSSTAWYIDQLKRKTYNASAIPSELTHNEYRDGVNDQVFVFTKDLWKNFFEREDAEGNTNSFPSFRKYINIEGITIQDAMKFLKTNSAEKDEILKRFFGEDKYERFNFLPTNKFILPVNKSNALKSGIIKKVDWDKVENQIIINYEGQTMFKNNLIMMDILANFDWKRSINFSSGGIYKSENLFYLNDYLQYDGFSYRLVPIKTPENNGDMGRVDAEDLYKVVKNYRWGNFKDLNTHFDETCTSNIISYRTSVSRAGIALALKGDKMKAKEILNLAEKEIPSQKYNDVRSLSSLVTTYIVAGDEQKGLQLANKLKKDIFKDYQYFRSLSPKYRLLSGELMKKPYEYSLVVEAVSEAYKMLGRKDDGYQYVVKSLEPIDKQYDNIIKDIQQLGREKSYMKMDDIQNVMPFYKFLFNVMKPYDSTYEEEKLSKIQNDLIRYTE